jgi:hypothetical protein
MKWLRALGVAAVVLVAGACAAAGPSTSQAASTSAVPSSAAEVFAATALQLGADYRVVGSFATTVGASRALQAFPVSPAPWPTLSAGHAAVLCYIDGQIPKGPPPDANGSVPPSFDRGIYAVVDGVSSLVEAGYRDHLPIIAP